MSLKRFICLKVYEHMKKEHNFKNNVLEIVREIPLGQTMTYAEVAKFASSPNACRAVGNILNKNMNPDIPCHRVIRSDGKTGGYNRGADLKIKILRKEKAIK